MCASKNKQEAQNPLILRCHRLMEAFAKSDDERDFYIDRLEGFLIYVDLDKPEAELQALEEELTQNADRYCLIPKLSFYETKKIMEGFVNEKVYDIDTKEKLLDIIQSKEARENFLEFIYDHHAEQEKWQQYYQERSRIRIIEWLRLNHFHFVFEEDLDFPRQLTEKLKHALFQPKVGKDIMTARKALFAKAKTYYSNEALNPRPKRGRPPKQAAKPDIEPQVTIDIYTTVPPPVRPFLFTPELSSSSSFSIFSSKFDSEEDLLSNRRQHINDADASLSQKLASLRSLSNRWVEKSPPPSTEKNPYAIDSSFDDDEDDEDDEDEEFREKPKSKQKASSKTTRASKAKAPAKKTSASKTAKPEKPKAKRIMPKESKKNSSSSTKPLKKLLPKKK
ncbi:UPF0158 family protein [Candidatus Protochlamydia phocaeensis]|uniref:UPF0158 family protein n=1 Tax=Candidatus Protochlamydia phocaeensis TaxID=1414722 RepID=UPI0008397727|nr:UPF0158 family protein [Candidatus Protochlamydia phocaeensis]